MVVNMVQELQRLGFSANESRAYVSLLQEHPSTAYDTAKRSGIPTSKIYEVLARLVEKEMVLEVYEDTKKRFVPVDVKEFIDAYKKEIAGSLAVIEKESRHIKGKDVSYITNISSYEGACDRVKTIIDAAKQRLLLSGWHEELSQFRERILNSPAKSAVVHFGKTELDYGMCYTHPVEDLLRNEKGGRQLHAVADGSEALSVTVHTDGSVEGAWSRNSGFARMAEDYIAHDIYILKAVAWLGEDMRAVFGERYDYLRDIFRNEVKR